MANIVILGGGITGLTVAQKLSVKFKGEVTLIEQADFLGGLAATPSKNGFVFDIGSHRLHSDCPKEALDYLTHTVGVELLKRPRNGALYFKGRFLRYPPNIINLLKSFSFHKVLKLSAGYLKKFIHMPKKDRSYQDAMIRAVGKNVYTTFYKDFAKKLWGMDPSKLATDGIRRRNTVINLRSIWRSMTGKDKYFFYPRHGIGEIARKMSEEMLGNGGTIMKGSKIKKISMQDDKITRLLVEDQTGKDVELKPAQVISTIPIDSLSEMIYGDKISAAGLLWRGLRVAYIHFEEELGLKNETFYFPDAGIRIGRVSEIKKYSPYLNTDLKGTLLTIEIPCSQTDEMWRISDEELLKICLEDLEKASILKGQVKVLKYFSLKIEKAYPIYHIGWKENFFRLYNDLNKIANLFLIGRKGLFLHCNIDHCIMQAIELADFIASNDPRGKAAWNKKVGRFLQFCARD